MSFIVLMRNPAILGLGAAVLAVGLFAGAQTWRLKSARVALAELRTVLTQTEGQRDAAVAANSALVTRVDAQNRAVAALEAAGRAREAEAGKRVARVLKTAPALPTGHGPVAMNEFLRALYP